MNAFLVDLEDKPGELARITEAIAAKGVDITAMSGATCGEHGKVAIITADEDAAAAALRTTGASFRMTDITDVMLPAQPGSLAKATLRLAESEVNIEAIMVLGMDGNNVRVAILTDAPAKARTILTLAAADPN
jgi:hypothetical protein